MDDRWMEYHARMAYLKRQEQRAVAYRRKIEAQIKAAGFGRYYRILQEALRATARRCCELIVDGKVTDHAEFERQAWISEAANEEIGRIKNLL